MSKVLVIVPTVERPKTCLRAVQSLCKQKYKDWECLVVKNGDKMPDKKYRQALSPALGGKVKMISVLNPGLPQALNTGCEAFLDEHEYFAVLEDDDEWMPNFLTSMTRAMQLFPKTDVAHCHQRQMPEKKQSNGGHMDSKRLLRQNWINFPMCLFRARLFKDAGGFDVLAGPATDWAWHLACVYGADANYKFVNETLVIHHWHGENYCLKVTNTAYIKKLIKRRKYGQ